MGTTLSVVHFTLSVVRPTLSVGHNALLIGQLQTYTLSVVHNARSVVSIYSIGCTQHSDHSPFLGKFLKTNSTKNYTVINHTVPRQVALGALDCNFLDEEALDDALER